MDNHALEQVVGRIRSQRKGLILQIRVASVGLAKTAGVITIDTVLVKSTDEAVKKVLGEDSGLEIALVLAKMKHDPNGKSGWPFREDSLC
jgi:hypothetical protein